VQDNWHDAQATVLGVQVAWLAHVVACQAVIHVQEDIKDKVAFVLVYDFLQLLVLTPYFGHVLWVDSHLFEVYEDAPSPVLEFVITANLDTDQATRLQERTNVFGKSHDLVDLR
jgi:hypothetical protein